MIPSKKVIGLLSFVIPFICLLVANGATAQEEPIFVNPPAEPTEVQLGLFLIGIDKISLPNSVFPTFDAELFLDMRWQDERLAFNANEAGTDRKIFLEHEAELELDRIWWPDIEIENGEGIRQTENLELIIFADGMVEYEERFVATIETNFDMRKFPFDNQELEIDIESFIWDERFVVFAPLQEKMGSETNHAGGEWIVTDISTEIYPEPEVRSDHDFSEFIFNVHVERLPGYYIWRIVPLFVLIALSWSAFWMVNEPMPGRMGRSFVALLTVVAFHRIISDMMPRISYMTFLDGMVIIAYLFTSITIIENVIVNYFRTKDNIEKANHIDMLARWLVPLGFVLCSGLVALLFLM